MSSAAGNVFLVVAPSGAGKSSLVNALLAQDPSIHLSVSCTTRAPRSEELDGKDYRFVTNDTFEQLRAGDQLLEWAQVHGNYYGTPRDAVDAAIRSGTDILLEIDWQGARQVERLFPRAVGIFILPPSIAALRDRLTRRGQDAPDVIERRIQGAAAEIAHASEFEYVIINQDFSVALQELSLIIGAARLRRENQAARHAALFASLGVRS